MTFNRDGYENELVGMRQALELPVVGMASPVWELPELRRLIAKYPDEARRALARGDDAASSSDPG